MVKIQLATGYLEVKEGTSFPLNFQVGDIRDISQRKGNFSKTITLVGSKNNNDLLNHYYDVNIIAGTFNVNALTTCSVIQDGIPVMEDASLQLTAVKKVQITDGYEHHVEYEVLVKDNKADFFTAINNLELTDIDFSDLNHTYDAFNVVSRFNNSVVDGFKYFLPGSGDAFYSTQEFKPAIFAKTYFDRIFQDAGFQYSWPDLAIDRFDRLIIPYNGDTDNFDYNDYTVKANAGPNTYTGTFFAGTAEFQNPQTIAGWTETEDPQNIYNPVTGVYSTPFNISSNNSQQYDYSVQIQYELRLVNSSGVTLYSGTNGFASPVFFQPQLVLTQNGVVCYTTNLYTNPAPLNASPSVTYAVQSPTSVANGTTTILSQTAVCTMALTAQNLPQLSQGRLAIKVPRILYGQTNQPALSPIWRTGSATGPACASGQIKIQAVITNIDISITPSNNIVAIGGTIDVNDYVPKKIKQNEFIKGIFNMYNLYAEVDKSQPNLLNLIHRDDYYDAGKEVDWTLKLAKDREQSLSFLPELTSKKVILTYAPDKDSPNETYTTATNQIYGQAEVVFDNEYVKDVTTKPVLFGPTPIIRTPFGAYVPMIAGQAPKTNLRILYDGTTRSCSPYHIYDYGTTGMTGVTSYPYVGHFDDPLNPTFDINFSTCAFYYYQPSSLTDNNLYNRYWRRTMGQINNGKMLTAFFNLKESDIQPLELNDKIRIDNSWWNINKVIDYNANGNELTQVELISIDNEVDFMPFINPFGTPGVGLPNISGIQQVGNSTVVKTKSMNSNVLTGGGIVGDVVNRGNVVPGGLRVMVATEGYSVEDDGIVTDNLVVRGRMNGIPVDPAYYKYTALLNQSGTADPTVDVKEGSFGDIVWTRQNQGEYQGAIQNWELGTILGSELTVMINNVNFDGVISAQYVPSNNTIDIFTTQIGVGFVDNYLVNTTIEIRYYKP
jgi:hypothetical protein